MLREVGDDGLEGKVLGDRYQIDHELGRGAMGVVYRGHRIKDGRPVAIKVIHHRLLTTPTMSERFVREAELAAKLSHKNLVGVLDVGELPDGRRWIVLELARGPNLAEVIKHGPVAAPRAIAILRQLCDGLEHAHRAGLVHRDLKPANIVIECDAAGVEVPQIIDFGIAVIDDASERLTRSGLVLGTPAYMAPEQAAGGKLDHRCDQYALGAIAYEMLAGVAPFRGRGADVARAHVDQQVPPIAIRIDALLEAIIRKMLAKRPDDRFTNVRAVNQMLELLASDRNRAAALLGMPVGEHAIPARRRTPAAVPVVRPRRARWPWVAGAGVGVLAGAIVIAATWPASVPSTQAVHLRPITPAPRRSCRCSGSSRVIRSWSHRASHRHARCRWLIPPRNRSSIATSRSRRGSSRRPPARRRAAMSRPPGSG
ncbi:MAG: serine/threonine-protein kinase [Kofleriaceae bacterium]